MFRSLINYLISLTILYLLVIYVSEFGNVYIKLSVIWLSIKLAGWLMTITRKYILYETVSSKNKAILITGCDSGFGNALARRMDSIGFTVFAACLFPDGDGAKTLSKESSKKLIVVPMDVTNDQSIQEAKEFVERNLDQNVLWAIVNNAGISHCSEIDWTPLEVLQRVYDVNATGTLRVTKAFLPFIKKSKGRIINLTSIGGRHYVPAIVGYCMSKSAAIALTTGLRIELAKWGVKVISVEPGFYSTPLTEKKTVFEEVEKLWKSAPENIRKEYGEKYMKSFKNYISTVLRTMNNPNIYEVTDCLEDSIAAREPMSMYFPCDIINKLVTQLLQNLPNTLSEYMHRFRLANGAKPIALMSKKQE